MFAPGASVQSAAASGPNDFDTRSGSSLASSIVAGLAAQYLELNKEATHEQVKSYLTTNIWSKKVLNAGPGSPRRIARVPGYVPLEELSYWLYIKFDAKPQEVSWYLEDASTLSVLDGRVANTVTTPYDEEFYELPHLVTGAYNLVFNDTGFDGFFSSANGNGWFRLASYAGDVQEVNYLDEWGDFPDSAVYSFDVI